MSTPSTPHHFNDFSPSNSSSRKSLSLSRTPSKTSLSVRADEMTRFTAIDSFACKASVCAANYPALSKTHSLFVSIMRGRLEKTGRKFTKRSPIMHRGYYARMEGQQMAIDRFLARTEGAAERQILYLGCGFDTAPIATLAHHESERESESESSSNNSAAASPPLRIFEVDFPDVIHLKHEIYSTESKILKTLHTGESAKKLPRGASSVLGAETIAEESEEEIAEEESESYTSSREKRRGHSPFLGTLSEEKESDKLSETKSARENNESSSAKDLSDLTPLTVKPDEEEEAGLYHTYYQLGALTLIAQDIRDAEMLVSALETAGFDRESPTLIITECVLVYLSQYETETLVSTLGEYLSSSHSVWISYDMITPHDTYGEMMMKNLHKAGFVLPGFEAFPTLASQEEKFLQRNKPRESEEKEDAQREKGRAGAWQIARSIDMLSFYNRVIPQSILDAIHRLEMLDEVEEWNMLMSHYCLTVVANDTTFESIVHELTDMRPPSTPSPVKVARGGFFA